MSQPYFDELGNPIVPDLTQSPGHEGSPLSSTASLAPSLQELQAQEPQASETIGYVPPTTLGASDGFPGGAVSQTNTFDPNAQTQDKTQGGLSSPDVPSQLSPEEQAAMAPTGSSVGNKGVPGSGPVAAAQAMSPDQAVAQAQQKYVGAEKAKGMADLAVKGAEADRSGDAEQQYRNQLTEADKAYQVRREGLERQADQETASWLQNQQVLAEKEPVRSRYWESQSGLGKAVWLMSVGMAAFANSRTPGAQNMAAQMLMHEVEADTQNQKDRLARELEVGNQRGKLLKDKQSQRMHDSEDDYSKTFQRLESVKRELLDRAKRPGSAEAAAVAAGADGMIAKLQLDTTQKMRDEGMAAKAKAEDRKFELQKQGIEIGAANARQAALIKHQEREGDANRQNARDIAEQKIEAKIQEGLNKAGAGNKDVWALPQKSTGFHSVNPDTGKTEDVAFDKDSRKEVYGAVSNANDRYTTLRRISKALDSTDDIDVVMKRNPALVSDMISLGYTTARQMDPRGIVTDTDFSHGLEAATGTDLSTVAGRGAFVTGLKANRNAVKGWVDKEANDMRVRVPKNLDMYRNSNLQKGEVQWEPPDMEGPDTKPKTADDTEAQYGTNSAKPFIKTEEEYNQLKAKDPEAMPKLLDEATKAIKDMTNDGHEDLATGTNTVNSIRASTLKALDDLAAKNPAMKDAVEQSKAAVSAESRAAFEKGQKAYEEAKSYLEAPYVMYGGAHYTKDEVVSQLHRSGLTNIDQQQIRDLLDEVNNFKGIGMSQKKD